MAPKRPRDPNQLAKSIIDIATGQKPDRDPTPEEQGKDPAAVIQEQAVVSLGPWPPDLELFIFVSKARWSCGLSPALRREATSNTEKAYSRSPGKC
jgi:hypothetical protein